MDESAQVTTRVSLADLERGSISPETLETAFGPSSLGIIIVEDLPHRFVELRWRLLVYASYLAQLPIEELERLTDADSNYDIGWSHGKEMLRNGHYDTLKGSFYVDTYEFSDEPDFTSGNRWPSTDLLPGFRETFRDCCNLINDIGALVGRVCDHYASRHVPEYSPGYLEDIVRTSTATKARLLHYFPQSHSPSSMGKHEQLPGQCARSPENDSTDGSWCSMHVDDGCLTGLTSAFYIDEACPLPNPMGTVLGDDTAVSNPPDSGAGLYVQSRTFEVQKVDIPADCLAFQTGHALELATGGRLKAVPHMVKGPSSRSSTVARNTLAVFMQPELDKVLDKKSGITFGDLIRSHHH